MFLKRNTFLLVGLLCCLSLWCKSTSAGSSFLSPAQKPQNRGKSPRAGRQVLEEPGRPREEEEEDEPHITVRAPFEIGITMTTEDLEEYGVMLQELVHRLLGDAETPEKP